VIDIQMKAQNGKLPTAGHDGHWELSEIWRDIDKDDSVRCAVLRGEGLGFSGGGDLALVQDMASDFAVRTRVWKEARDLVYNVINCDKPIVSAMHGPAVGAGLVAGLLADISIAAKTRRSWTATPAWAWRPATMPPSSGRCCAAWPRPSTT
jgi:enoyl-CoA hydratase